MGDELVATSSIVFRVVCLIFGEHSAYFLSLVGGEMAISEDHATFVVCNGDCLISWSRLLGIWTILIERSRMYIGCSALVFLLGTAF